MVIACLHIFNSHRELGQGKRYNTLTNTRMTGYNSSENSDILKAHRDNAEASILTQKEVDEKIRTYFALWIKQLQDLIRLIQGRSSVFRQNFSSSVSTFANPSAAGPSPDEDI